MVYASMSQGKFKEYASLIFKNQEEWDKTGVDFIPFFTKYAESLGMDVAKLKADSANPAIAATIESDAKDGQDLSIYATPTVLFVGPKGSTYTQGAVQESELQKAVDSVK